MIRIRGALRKPDIVCSPLRDISLYLTPNTLYQQLVVGDPAALTHIMQRNIYDYREFPIVVFQPLPLILMFGSIRSQRSCSSAPGPTSWQVFGMGRGWIRAQEDARDFLVIPFSGIYQRRNKWFLSSRIEGKRSQKMSLSMIILNPALWPGRIISRESLHWQRRQCACQYSRVGESSSVNQIFLPIFKGTKHPVIYDGQSGNYRPIWFWARLLWGRRASVHCGDLARNGYYGDVSTWDLRQWLLSHPLFIFWPDLYTV